MALDPRIPLMAQGMNLEPRSNALMRAAQLQGTQDTNALRQMQMQQMQQAAQQTMMERQAAAQREQSMMGYLQSMSGQAGPPQPFNPAEAAQRLGIDGASKLQGLMQPKGSEGFTLTPGGMRFGPEGKLIASAPFAPEKPQAPPEIVRLMQYRDSLPPNDPNRRVIDAQIQKSTTHAPAAQAISYGSPVPIMLPDGSIGYAQPGNRPGAQPQIMSGPGGKPLVKPGESEKPPTGEQSLAAGYATRMEEASKLVSRFEKDGRPGYLQAAAGTVGDTTRAGVSSPVQQQYRQAQEDWVRAKLRKESGAAIPPDEMDREIAAYFPLPTEKAPEVIAQKARARAVANEAMKKAAGKASYKSEVPPLPDNPAKVGDLTPAEAEELARLRAWRDQGAKK